MELLNRKTSLSLGALFFLALMAHSANGYKFVVGGRSGWTLNPIEGYNHWAERNRFQVNDTLYFKYDKNTDSVLFVDEEDYKNCNPNKPLRKLEGGESVFKFDRSGPFFFITGNATNCQHGQKLIVVVLAVRPPPPPPHVQPPAATPPGPPPSPAPASQPPAATPPGPPLSPAPASQPPAATPPGPPPTPAPASPTPSAPAPAAESPPVPTPSASEVSPPQGKSAGAAAFGPAAVVLSAAGVLLGWSVISVGLV